MILEIIDIILEALNIFGFYIQEHKDLIYTFSILLATIFIPFSLHILGTIDKKNFVELDGILFHKKYLKLGELIFIYSFLFFVLLGWQEDNNYDYFGLIIFSILILSITLIGFLIKRLNILYNFNLRKHLRNEERIVFLKDVGINKKYVGINKDEDFNIWENTLKSDFGNNSLFLKNTINTLFEVIKSEIDKIKDENKEYQKIEKIRNLLFSYNSINKKISFNAFFDFSDGNLVKFLEIHYLLFQKGKDGIYIWIDSDLNLILREKLENIINNNLGASRFYKTFKDHLEENNNEEYTRSILETILDIFFNSDKILGNRSIIKQFPFKIKVSELKKDKIQQIVLSKSFKYIVQKIQSSYGDENKKYDGKIDNILEHWFEDFEIITLSDILYIIFFPYGENRAKSILNGNRGFGYIGRVKSYSGNFDSKKREKESEKEYYETILNFKMLFPGFINKESLEKLVNEFNELISSYELDENKKWRAKGYKKLIEDLLKD